MKEIKLTQGQVAFVDDEDFEYLNKFKWHALKRGQRYYAMKRIYLGKYKYSAISMHKFIIGKPQSGFDIDHINGNGVDNQKCNLRFVTRRQNLQNRHNGTRSSKYPGVSLKKNRRKKWGATIGINGVKKHLGYFRKEIDAFNTYKREVEKLGEVIIDKF